MGVGDDIAVAGEDHPGAAGVPGVAGAENGHHRRNVLLINILQRQAPLRRQILRAGGGLLQINGLAGGPGGAGLGDGHRRGLGLRHGEADQVGLILLQLELLEQLDVEHPQHGDDAAQENDQDQQQRHHAKAALGRVHRPGAVDAVVPIRVLNFFSFIHRDTSLCWEREIVFLEKVGKLSRQGRMHPGESVRAVRECPFLVPARKGPKEPGSRGAESRAPARPSRPLENPPARIWLGAALRNRQDFRLVAAKRRRAVPRRPPCRGRVPLMRASAKPRPGLGGTATAVTENAVHTPSRIAPRRNETHPPPVIPRVASEVEESSHFVNCIRPLGA